MSHQDHPGDGNLLSEKAGQSRTGVVGDYWRFLRRDRKWWMLPILLVLFVAGGIVVLAATAGAPLLYALF